MICLDRSFSVCLPAFDWLSRRGGPEHRTDCASCIIKSLNNEFSLHYATLSLNAFFLAAIPHAIPLWVSCPSAVRASCALRTPPPCFEIRRVCNASLGMGIQVVYSSPLLFCGLVVGQPLSVQVVVIPAHLSLDQSISRSIPTKIIPPPRNKPGGADGGQARGPPQRGAGEAAAHPQPVQRAGGLTTTAVSTAGVDSVARGWRACFLWLPQDGGKWHTLHM